ncbi:MAG: hypothetical protein HZB56_04860 [Deltaproteobacteria bacterium]|nr:hypothetical protein [Deltaproteobacteria bacterium]
MAPGTTAVDRLLAALAAVLAAVAVLVPSGAYFLFAHRYAQGSLETEAATTARAVTRVVSANPTMWRFETVRLRELLALRPPGNPVETRRLVDLEGALVAESAEPLDGPVIRTSQPVLDSGVVVARVQISRSLRPAMLRAALLALLLLPVAGAAYLLLRVLPARAIRRAEEARLRFEEQARHAQRLEAIGRLAGGVAHDFNNLLAAILAFARGLQDDLPAGSPSREYADEIVAAARRGAQVTRSLLAFSRRQDLELHRLDVNDLVRRAEALLRTTVGPKVELGIKLGVEPLPVLGDGVQLELVLLNLASNARDALAPGGRVEVSTRRLDVEQGGAPRVRLRPGAYAALSVADTGTGMDAETQQRVFDPFFTTKEVGKGTGLGLSMAHGVLRQHGGSIQVESTPGQGSRFTLYLPLATGGPVQPSLFEEETLTGETPAAGTPLAQAPRKQPH